MKVIGYVILYVFLTIFYYLLFSCVGLLFFDGSGKHLAYNDIISVQPWFIMYMLFIHWWLVVMSLMEYYNKYIKGINF